MLSMGVRTLRYLHHFVGLVSQQLRLKEALLAQYLFLSLLFQGLAGELVLLPLLQGAVLIRR